ncbi:MAG: autotransporter-associated beta strand repeat-containing protein [Verrucomicrobiae bacterium]
MFSNTGTTLVEGGNSTGTGSNTTLTLGSGGITVNSGAGAVTIGSATGSYALAVTLGANQTWTNNSSNTLTKAGTTNNAVDLGANTLTVDGSGNTLIAPVITGSGSVALVKAGAGTLSLANTANSYTGNTSINAGTLLISGNGSLGAASAFSTNGKYSVASGATLAVANAVTDADILAMRGTTNFQAGSRLGFDTTTGNRTSSAVLTNTSQGALGLDKIGTNTLTLSGNNTYTGPTTIKAGTLKVTATASSNAFGGNGTIIVGDAANTGAAATLEFNSASAFPTFTNAISIVGNGTSTISALNYSPVFNGAVTLSNNLTILSNNSSGSSLTFNGGITGAGNILVRVQSGANGASKVTFATAAVNNNGTLTFDNVSYTGNATNTITGGVGSNVTGIFQDSTNSPLTISGGAVQVNAGGTTLGGNGTAAFTISSVITGAGGIAKSGSGNLTLSGNNTFTGGVTLNAGLLNINHSGALGGAGNTFTINGGSINNTAGSLVTAQNNPVNIGADFTFVGGTNDLSFGNGTVTLNGTAGSRTITVNSGNLTLGGVVASGTASGLTKSGAGTLVLAGASSNTYTGPTTIKAGTLSIATALGSNAFGGNGTIVIGDAANTGAAATLNFNGNGANFPAFNNAINIVGNGTSTLSATSWNPFFNGNVTLSNNLTILSNNAGGSVLTFNGTFGGTGNIHVTVQNGSANSSVAFNGNVNNSGTLTFDNISWTGNRTNTITGGVGPNVTAITQASSNSTLTISTNAIQVNSAGTTLTASGTAQFAVTGGISGTGNLTLNTNNNTNGISVATTTINNAGTVTNSGTGTVATTISAVIGTNVTGLAQNSATSQLALSATNTYTGGTLITAGSLVLSGTGSINSTSGVSVATGATFTNSSSVGYNKGLTLAEGATLSGTGTFAPTGMTLTANLSDGFTTIALGNLLTRAYNLELTLTGITGGTYTLFSGTLNGAFGTMTVGGSSLSGSGGNFNGTVGGNTYAFTNANSQLVVTIPEPATWALLAVSLIVLTALRRRHSS